MNIGEPVRRVEDVPRPIPVRRIAPPPEREKVPMRRREPVREPAKVLPGSSMVVTEIPYMCPAPRCGRRVEMEDGVLICPVHGVVWDSG